MNLNKGQHEGSTLRASRDHGHAYNNPSWTRITAIHCWQTQWPSAAVLRLLAANFVFVKASHSRSDYTIDLLKSLA